MLSTMGALTFTLDFHLTIAAPAVPVPKNRLQKKQNTKAENFKLRGILLLLDFAYDILIRRFLSIAAMKENFVEMLPDTDFSNFLTCPPLCRYTPFCR